MLSRQDGVLPRQWKTWTWQQYWDECVAFAKALVHLKVANFKTVNIIGFNSVSPLSIYSCRHNSS